MQLTLWLWPSTKGPLNFGHTFLMPVPLRSPQVLTSICIYLGIYSTHSLLCQRVLDMCRYVQVGQQHRQWWNKKVLRIAQVLVAN